MLYQEFNVLCYFITFVKFVAQHFDKIIPSQSRKKIYRKSVKGLFIDHAHLRKPRKEIKTI